MRLVNLAQTTMKTIRKMYAIWKIENKNLIDRFQIDKDILQGYRCSIKDEREYLLELSKDEVAREQIYNLLKDKKDDRVKMFLPKRDIEKGKINDEMINKAKEYHIDSLIEIDRMNKALCVWHSDTQPSMKYYDKTNTVYCFACNKGGDSIALYREINNCDFKTAVLEMQ